jgi:hypothetical protein
MNYNEVKEKLEAVKLDLTLKIQNPNLSPEEKEIIKNSILNYEYMLELTEMNHFGRGSIIH